MAKQEAKEDYYNRMYKEGGWQGNYLKHYTHSPYFETWKRVLALIGDLSNKKILDIGCGVGQFASFLKDNGLRNYCGIDFSREAISQAKQKELEGFIFKQENIFCSSIFEEKFDCVVILEVLEHLNEDLHLLSLLKPKTRVILSVPNYDSASHVRFFENLDLVIERYKDLIQIQESESIVINNGAGIIFLLKGMRF